MRDSTSELMRLCIEKVELEGEDAVFFQNVMNALLHAETKSECRAQLEEAQVWFDKWRPLETRDLDWASDRLAKLHQSICFRRTCSSGPSKLYAPRSSSGGRTLGPR